jgi:aspartokinase-like uncharacterized kinase
LRKSDELDHVWRETTDLIPIFIGKDVAWVPPLDSSAVQEDIDIMPIADHC